MSDAELIDTIVANYPAWERPRMAAEMAELLNAPTRSQAERIRELATRSEGLPPTSDVLFLTATEVLELVALIIVCSFVTQFYYVSAGAVLVAVAFIAYVIGTRRGFRARNR